jgi:hypothetical protein
MIENRFPQDKVFNRTCQRRGAKKRREAQRMYSLSIRIKNALGIINEMSFQLFARHLVGGD